MAAVVHGGSLGRWFEQLCRIEVPRIRDVVRVRASGPAATYSLDPKNGTIPKDGGVYTFWWTGPSDLLRRRDRHLVLKGPGGRDVGLEIDDEWLGASTTLPIPLYVGKTAENLRNRIKLHLLLGRPGRVMPKGKAKGKAPTTSCQLRAGYERLFRSDGSPVESILDNVGISFVVLHGDDHAGNRFYLEDLAIGLMRPPLNVDIER